MGFFRDKAGWACEDDPETGGKRCRKFNATKGASLATGTDVTLITDPKTCRVVVLGHSTILNEDEDDLRRVAKRMEASCKGGLQTE